MANLHSPFKRFHHVVVAVPDPAETSARWAHLFGTEVLPLNRVAVGDSWVEFVAPAGDSEDHDGDRTGIVRVAVEVDDIAEVAATAASAGAKSTVTGGRTIVEVTGVRIELRERAESVRSSRPVAFSRFHHLVVAVRDDARAIDQWQRAFPFTPAPEGPDGHVAENHLPVGDSWFGFTSTGPAGDAVAKFIERRGEGVYALSLVVPDPVAFAASVTEAGGRVLGGAADSQIFVHPSSTHGVLVELTAEWPDGIRRPAAGDELA